MNPLDVLRQRLLLEIARRQMKENTRQVSFPETGKMREGVREIEENKIKIEIL